MVDAISKFPPDYKKNMFSCVVRFRATGALPCRGASPCQIRYYRMSWVERAAEGSPMASGEQEKMLRGLNDEKYHSFKVLT